MKKGATPDKRMALKKRASPILIIGSILFAAFIIVLIVAASLSQNSKNVAAREAAAAEQARIMADPINANDVYTAINKERPVAGAQALSTLSNLTTAAQQKCDDMVAGKYFKYTNPTTGKVSNSYITDNIGDLYYKTATSSIFSGNPAVQTATDIVNLNVKSQAQTLNDPSFNSVGWAVCQPVDNPTQTYVVGMLADIENKPVAPATVYRPTYPTPTHCYTTYNNGFAPYVNPSASTNCY